MGRNAERLHYRTSRGYKSILSRLICSFLSNAANLIHLLMLVLYCYKIVFKLVELFTAYIILMDIYFLQIHYYSSLLEYSLLVLLHSTYT